MEMAVSASAMPAEDSRRETVPFQFTGTGAEYFRIWIVNLLLTLLTLGIYSAWAKVRRLRYYYGSTSVAGSAFEYHGEPIQILKGRLIALGALLVYSVAGQLSPVFAIILMPFFAIAVPWVVVRSRKFQMQVTSWRNIRFHFHGTYGQASAAYIGWAIVAVITFYIMLPRLLYARVKFLVSGTSFGSQRLELKKGSGPYFALFYMSLLMGLAALVVAFIFTLVLGLGLGISLQGGDGVNRIGQFMISLIMSGVFALVFIPVAAYFERRFVNETLDGIRIGPHTVRCEMQTGPLAMIYITNLLGMIFTLGLFYPWARMRRMKYQFDSMSLETVGSLDTFVEEADAKTSATGEEIGEFFDVDFGF